MGHRLLSFAGRAFALSLWLASIDPIAAAGPAPSAAPLVTLTPAQAIQCSPGLPTCEGHDAVVFVHGIYGDDDTFVNGTTNFDWPVQFPREISGRPVDVFRLNHMNAMLAWSAGSNPSFLGVAKQIHAVMTPLRERRYRSIGFIAHSLGGNLVSTYIHYVKTAKGHPQRAQHAYAITLATPALGSQMADTGSLLKSMLGMSDPLLDSLKTQNLYLEMLLAFREAEGPKGEELGCRAVNLHAAYEKKHMGPFLIVAERSAADAVAASVASPVVGFDLDHSQMAKPAGRDDQVYQWVAKVIEREFARLASWDAAVASRDPSYRLCRKAPLPD